MPFTFSHPALVLPLTYLPKTWFSLTGLVIGSLAPDFEYFLRMKVTSHYSHTISGLVWFDLPLGILLVFMFHNIVRNPLIENLPSFLNSRFSTYIGFEWNTYFRKNWLVVIISLLIGVASHLLWDSFTHNHGYFVEALPALTETVTLFGKEIPVFKILQHSSTVLGAILIGYAIYRLPVINTGKARLIAKYWGLVAAVSFIIIATRLFTGLNFHQYGNVIVTVISAVLISITLTPMLLKLKN
jgi:hypothetical protein